MPQPDWIEFEENRTRNLGDPSRYRVAPRDDRGVDADHWHHWDYRLRPGAYELILLSSEADWINWFNIGPVPNANQPEPIRLEARFGTIANKAVEFLREPVRFQVTSGTVIRIEAWVRVPDRKNPAPLPPGFDYWLVPYPGGYTWHDVDSFENTFQAVSRRTFANGRIEFGMEDAGDNDFNDLVVALQPH